MLSLIVILLLAVVLILYVAIPLLFPSQADPLPDDRDPLLQDLEEERDALLRAIQELDSREDLAEERREQLRARYEVKAAKVLRALDERQMILRGGAPKVPNASAKPVRLPVATFALLAIMVLSASVLGGYVLPRVGDDATLTTFDEGRLEAGRRLQELQRAASSEPSAENLLALADAYWQLDDADNARQSYQRVIDEVDLVPAVAYQRLGFLTLQDDIHQAREYLQQANNLDPSNLDTLFFLGEINFALEDMDAAIDAWEAYLEAPGGGENEMVASRLELAQTLAPHLARIEEAPNEENVMALGDTYWNMQQRELAADAYFRVLTEINPDNARALSRVGQVLFFSGSNENAVGFLARARELEPEDLSTLLFLGNAYFTLDMNQEAISVWEEYIEVAGGRERAGRVPQLIEDAEARLAGDTVDVDQAALPGVPGDVAGMPGEVPPAPTDDMAGALTQESVDPFAGGDEDPEAVHESDELPDESDALYAEAAEEDAKDDEDVYTEDDEDSAVDEALFARGEQIYAQSCAGCHGADGSQGMYDMNNNRFLEDSEGFRQIIRQGRGSMPAFGNALDEEALTALEHYMRVTFLDDEDD